GGGAQGENAIWSHRWYVQLTGIGDGGPTVDGETVPLGGTQIGQSKYWIGDYTIEPENGGVGVFAHEFGHDLGLPDLYDTSGNTGGAENSTAFWTLMSSGSYGSSGRPEDGIGSKPMHLGAWEKFQLGWLDYEVAQAGQSSRHTLGPAETTSRQAQGVFVLLPDKKVPLELGAPFAGERFFYSGSGDDLDNTMTREVTVPAGGGALAAKVRYDIEQDWDYAYLTVNGESVPTSLSTDTDPNGQNFGNGITGSSQGQWVDLTADLSAFAGQTVTLGFRYWTDGAVAEPGFQADNVTLDGTSVGTAESDEGWTFAGFRTTTGSEIQEFFNAYVGENRQYDGYDTSLKTAYNFSTPLTNPDRVESYPYQNGLLLSYWNSQYTDNNVGDHPGGGLILPIDAHPTLPHWSDGTLMRPRAASYDSTFGLEKTDAIELHTQTLDNAGRVVDLIGSIASQAAVPTFDDTGVWWYASDGHVKKGAHPGRYQPGWYGVDPPSTGTTISVQSSSGSAMTVKVAPK
ncbi:MAG: M6 family metalloprotease domain-containing protein, partial [Nocardioides sp.]